MSDSATITRQQLRTVLIATELGDKEGDSQHFSYAKLGKSTYSFGQMQFDVGKSDHDVRSFLKSNGFDDVDINKLSKHGGLSQKELDALDAKLQKIPQTKIDQFTNDQLDKNISSVGDVIDEVRQINPAMANAIIKDPKLQLGIADYNNQFGSVGPQAVQFLAGKSQTLKATGITVQAGNPPTREDIQAFIGACGFGHDPANANGIAGREWHNPLAKNVRSAKMIRRFGKEDSMSHVRSTFVTLSVIGALMLAGMVSPVRAQNPTASDPQAVEDHRIHIRASLQTCIDRADANTWNVRDCYVAETNYHDNRLNRAYKLLMVKLDAGNRATLRDDERKWIKHRDAQCAKSADAGQQEILEGYECSMTETAKRATELEWRSSNTK